jgi:hypothetical protein
MLMAEKVIIEFVDDIDTTSAADETVTFMLDGVTYEIDLAAKNAEKMRTALQPWVHAGRRVGGRRVPAAPVGRPSLDARQAAAVRAWARDHGYQVARRGRISAEVISAFRSAG